jgi:GNAT superfamily N-acetyltransferase
MIKIKTVRSKKDLRLFIKTAWPLYKDNPHWVPPLISDLEAMLTPGRNPFWENAERELFLASKDEKIVGRIAATLSRKHNELYKEKTGFFGFYESADDQDVAHALYGTAAQWLASRGMTHMRGPMNPNINEEIGFLVKGFDQDPFVMMPYTLPYYPNLAEAEGLAKIKDVHSYWAPTEDGMPTKVERIVNLIRKRYKITVRPIDMKNLAEEAVLIKEVHDEAWKDNWGAVPFTDAEFTHIVKQLKPIAIPDFVPIVELDGRIVAMAVATPDANQVLRYANGRLFPFGLIKILLNQHKVNRVRVLILGVLSAYRRCGFDALLYYELFKAARKHGFVGGEFSWILEDNLKMIHIIESWGGKITKTYRVYQKPIKPVDRSKRKWDYLF